MKLEKLKARRAKLDDRIRKAASREREQRQRELVKLARKHGLLALDAPVLETTLAKIAKTAESASSTDAADLAMNRTRTASDDAPPQTAQVALKKS